MKSTIKGPDHYKRGDIQPWDFIRDQGLNYHLGNVVKYICRAGHKDDDIEDLSKAIHYLSNEIEYRTRKRVQECVSDTKFSDSASTNVTEISDRRGI